MKSSPSNKKEPMRSLLQKTYGKPKPVREYQRFQKTKTADTGEDPQGAMREFIKNDLVRPLERIKTPPKKTVVDMGKWALGVEKKCPSPEKLPKVQQLREYTFVKRTDSDVEKYRSYFHDTNHIAIRVPKIEKKDDNTSYLKMKEKFGSHSTTFKEGWVPLGNLKTVNNRSSVVYNILSPNENNSISGNLVMKILDKKVANKKKSIAEFADLTRPFNPNVNPKYKECYSGSENMFHRYNGIYSHMYDAAHRNGNIYVPFRNNAIQSDRRDSPRAKKNLSTRD